MNTTGDDPQEQHRRWLVEAGHVASRDFDRTVVLMAGSALTLSITSVNSLVPTPVLCSTPWVALGWTSLILSLLAILISMLTSQHAIKNEILALDAGTATQERSPGGGFAFATHLLNVFAATTLVLGFVFILVFVLMNYSGGRHA